MALSPMETHDEELGQLRRLAQSPAWGLFSSRVLKRVASSEQEKARLLREGMLQQAMAMQCRVDGLREALDILPQLIEEVQPKEDVGSY